MKACPHCSGTTGYAVRVRAVGFTTHNGTWDGMHEDITNTSDLRFTADKTVKCLDCGKRTLMKRVRDT